MVRNKGGQVPLRVDFTHTHSAEGLPSFAGLVALRAAGVVDT